MKMRAIVVAVIIVLAAVFLGYCYQNAQKEHKENNLEKIKSSEGESNKGVSGEPEAAVEPPIIFAVHPYASPVELTRSFGPLLKYLQERTGRTFSMVVSQSYESHIARVGSDEVDVAFMGPAVYVAMSEQFGKKRLLSCFETNGSPDFQGYIIVRKDSPATSLADLQDKSFASSSRISTMSYVVPRYMFIEAGIPFPSKQHFVGSHNNVCLNILAGDVYAGGVREKTYQKYKERDLKVIAISPKVTEHSFVATDRLDDTLCTQIRQAMINIKSKEEIEKLLKPIKSTMSGLAAVEDKDYDRLRVIMASVSEDERSRAEEGKQAE